MSGPDSTGLLGSPTLTGIFFSMCVKKGSPPRRGSFFVPAGAIRAHKTARVEIRSLHSATKLRFVQDQFPRNPESTSRIDSQERSGAWDRGNCPPSDRFAKREPRGTSLSASVDVTGRAHVTLCTTLLSRCERPSARSATDDWSAMWQYFEVGERRSSPPLASRAPFVCRGGPRTAPGRAESVMVGASPGGRQCP